MLQERLRNEKYVYHTVHFLCAVLLNVWFEL